MRGTATACLLALLGLALGGCHGRHVRTATALAEDRPVCAAPREHRPMQPPRPGPTPPLPHAREALSERALTAAVRLGLADEVEELASLAQRDELDEAALRRREQLLHRIRDTVQVTTNSIHALAAELECEEELAVRLARVLARGQERRTTTLTAVAIAMGAVAAITAGALALAGHGRAAEGVAIGGGSAEAALGTTILLQRTRAVTLAHPHNHLQEVWRGRDHAHLLPPFVWAWLDAPDGEGETTLRERILRRLRSEAPDRRDLLLGDGGPYTGADLLLRADLIDMLEDQIEMIYRDLVIVLEQGLALGLP
jgi:hypothetical protein